MTRNIYTDKVSLSRPVKNLGKHNNEAGNGFDNDGVEAIDSKIQAVRISLRNVKRQLETCDDFAHWNNLHRLLNLTQMRLDALLRARLTLQS